MTDLPAVDRPAPVEPADLDGWSAVDMTGWLADACRVLAEAERRTDEMRVSVGMVLYRLRVELGDGAYGEAVDQVAREAGVTARSLRDWRTRAEQHLQLPAPSVRTVARRQRADREHTQEALPKSPARPRRSSPAPRGKPSLPSSTVTCPTCKGTGRVPRAGRTPAGRCSHPIGRRIGDGCGECGEPRAHTRR